MIIPGFSAYDVDEHGVVTEIATGKVIKSKFNRYWFVRLTDDDGCRFTIGVHNLMARAFLPPIIGTDAVTFRDNNPRNIELSNIVIMSRSELSKLHINDKQGRRKSKTYSDEARAMLLDTMSVLDGPITLADLSELLGVHYSTIRYTMQKMIEDGQAAKVEGGFVLL